MALGGHPFRNVPLLSLIHICQNHRRCVYYRNRYRRHSGQQCGKSRSRVCLYLRRYVRPHSRHRCRSGGNRAAHRRRHVPDHQRRRQCKRQHRQIRKLSLIHISHPRLLTLLKIQSLKLRILPSLKVMKVMQRRYWNCLKIPKLPHCSSSWQKLYKVPPSEERLSLCERFSSFEPLCTVTKHFFC